MKKKRFLGCPKVTFQPGFQPGTIEFPTYLPNYLTRPNDFDYPTTCVFLCFSIHLLGGLTIHYFLHYFRHDMFSYVIADAIANTLSIL